MNKYILYPGCSMESSGKAYGEAINTILQPLDLHFEEIEDWNCCGATEYLGINLIPAYSLIARNLALASKQMNGTRTVVAPCSACYLNLAKADIKLLSLAFWDAYLKRDEHAKEWRTEGGVQKWLESEATYEFREKPQL